MSMRIDDTKIGCGRTILPFRDGHYRTWPLPGLGRLASPATRPPQAAAWEPALRHGDWRTPRGRLTGASEKNARVSIEAKAPPHCSHTVRLPAERTNERPTNHCSRLRDATALRDDARYCQRVSDICAFDLVVSTRSQEFAAVRSLSRCVSHLTVLFADDWGPDQRDREADRWPVCLKCSTGLSACGHLTGKPLAGSISHDDNPATSLSPFPVHCDLPTEENKYSRSERSGFAEPAHIAAETLLATRRRTRCALKQFADRSQQTLLGMLSQEPCMAISKHFFASTPYRFTCWQI